MNELAPQDGAALGKIDAYEAYLAVRELVDLHGPRHGHEAKNRIDDFFVRVDYLCDIRPVAS